MSDTQYLTNEKFAELKKELDFLKSDRRAEVATHLEYAKKLGDLSENAEYHQAREEQAEVEDRIRHLEDLLKTASIIGAQGGDHINIGSIVEVQKEGDSKVAKYIIVGSEEADMAQAKLSNLSPLGCMLIGKKKGDSVSVSTPKGKMTYKILSV